MTAGQHSVWSTCARKIHFSFFDGYRVPFYLQKQLPIDHPQLLVAIMRFLSIGLRVHS